MEKDTYKETLEAFETKILKTLYNVDKPYNSFISDMKEEPRKALRNLIESYCQEKDPQFAEFIVSLEEEADEINYHHYTDQGLTGYLWKNRLIRNRNGQQGAQAMKNDFKKERISNLHYLLEAKKEKISFKDIVCTVINENFTDITQPDLGQYTTLTILLQSMGYNCSLQEGLFCSEERYWISLQNGKKYVVDLKTNEKVIETFPGDLGMYIAYAPTATQQTNKTYNLDTLIKKDQKEVPTLPKKKLTKTKLIGIAAGLLIGISSITFLAGNGIQYFLQYQNNAEAEEKPEETKQQLSLTEPEIEDNQTEQVHEVPASFSIPLPYQKRKHISEDNNNENDFYLKGITLPR